MEAILNWSLQMKITILIVEDEPITARFITETLLENGYDIAGVARSADEARKLLAQYDINIVLMDINIKGKEDGIQFSRTLINEDIAIIYISAYSNLETIKEAACTMPYGFLVKPFKEVELLRVLILASSKLEAKYNKTIPINKANFEEKLYFLEQNGLKLSKKERLCLKYFISKPNSIVTVDELNETIWKEKNVGNSTIRELINRLRKKVDCLDIQNIYSTGYILK